MPTYDYRCESCGEQVELRLKFSDDIDQPCKQCGEIATRQFSAVPIVFKGSGWYVNDYGKKGSSSGKQNDPSSSKKESPTQMMEGERTCISCGKRISNADYQLYNANCNVCALGILDTLL